MINSAGDKFERAAELVSRFYKHALVQDANSLTIKCSKCEFTIDPRILLFGGEAAITKMLDSFGKCGAAKMAYAFELHAEAMRNMETCQDD